MNLKIPKIVIFYFATGLILLIVIIIVIINLLRPESPTTQIPPTPTPVATTKPQNTSSIKEDEVSPPENLTGTAIKNPSQKVVFTLSQNVTPEDIRVTISPSLPHIIEQGATANEIIVYPDPPEFWRANVLYLVTLYDQNNNVITSYNIKVPQFKPQYDPL